MSSKNSPFNSPLEIGIRCLALLDSSYPTGLDVNRLVDFDYLLIHSGDIDGPKSLHPPLPLRTGEIIIKRKLIQRALFLMINKKLIKRKATNDGIQYYLDENGRPFIRSLNSEYVEKLTDRANWVLEEYGSTSDEALRALISNFFDRWTTNFQSTERYSE
ncbi:ABC-three component system middle component 2 [Gracilimonas sp. Q87]|uniref:ABC-three component system middle component 2 n=1 Tax=Gracilimonas sp. Q87 TaxID=3384766 RepID=UPI00398431E7